MFKRREILLDTHIKVSTQSMTSMTISQYDHMIYSLDTDSVIVIFN